MNIPPTAASGDKRPRAGRVVPRRHVEPVETAEATPYDSGEFPVLLRLPDIVLAEVHAVGEPPTGEQPEPEGSGSPRGSAAVARQRQRRGIETLAPGVGVTWRLTGAAARQFWSTMAPKVAVGGMLLAVAALCFVLVRGPSTSEPGPADPSQWANDPPLQSTDLPTTQAATDVHSSVEVPAANNWPTKSASVASKPTTVVGTPASAPAASPGWSSPPVGPASSTEPSSSMSEGWSAGGAMSTQPMSGSTPVAPRRNDSAPVQGWPDETSTNSNPASQDSELEFNRAARLQASPDRPAAQTALRESLPAANPSGARLNGTVVIPNSGMDYR